MNNKTIWEIKENSEKNCILDLDDVLGDSIPNWVSFVNKEKNSEYKTLWDLKNNLSYSEYKSLKIKYRESGEKLNIKVKEGAIEFCEALKQMGYTIIILTRRPFYLHKTLFSQTKRWLEQNRIEYDALVFEDKKHLKVLSEIENCQFIVDDNRYICTIMGKFGFKVFIINSIYNQGSLNENVIRVSKLSEILDHIK